MPLPAPLSAAAQRFSRATDLFLQARHLTGDARNDFLRQACADDQDLLREVQKLFRGESKAAMLENLESELHEAHQKLHDASLTVVAAASRGLSGLSGRGGSASAGSASEAIGSFVRQYQLLRLLGEGGFGSVYLAEQTQPVRRKVALKLIKLGMDSRQVVARFELERQALAMMDHPNIAKVFDAGTSESGRPYFVMELVEGVPITQ